MYRYPLTPEQQTVLLDKMDVYCMAQNGMSLESYQEQYREELDNLNMEPQL